MMYEAGLGNRTVAYYGESAYWVNVDVDVPLFLPIYAQRRLYDLRRIASLEKASGAHIHGQMVFDSGWEWGYWLNTAVAGRGAWDPVLSESDEWSAFAKSLQMFTRLLGPQLGGRLEKLLVDLTRRQAELLILGMVNGTESPNIAKLSGIAYLCGSDTWVELPRMFGLKLTQPDKIKMFEADDPDWIYVLPLLREMESTFHGFSIEMQHLLNDALSINSGSTVCSAADGAVPPGECPNHDSPHIAAAAIRVLEEFCDGVQMLHLRAKQVRLLYAAQEAEVELDYKAQLLTDSRKVIALAQTVVARRESKYRVPRERIASWRENPTVYRFGYLWAVHSLYYWWRDQGLAERGSLQSHYSPCYLNRMDASEVAVGWGKYTLELMRTLIHYYSPSSARYPIEVVNCIAPPGTEYVFPRDLYFY